MTRFPCIGAYVPMQHEAKYDPFTRGISMRCHYCQHESGHDKTCPEAAPDIRQRFQRYAVWQLGYRSGFTTAEWGKNIGPADTWIIHAAMDTLRHPWLEAKVKRLTAGT